MSSTENLQSDPRGDAEQLGQALHRCVSSTHHDEVGLPEGLMPGDHANVPHHWYSKYVTKLSDVAEAYSATSGWGNDVINRRTGEKVWEPMPLYTRLGMHMLFVGKLQDEVLEDGYLERLFLKESEEQGKHFDDPKSVAKIPHFIKTYNIPVDDLLIPDLEHGYKNFNEFFYRKLRPEARPAEEPENPNRIVSPADCRSVLFPVKEVTKYWIKGDEFTVGTLIQDDEMAKGYSHIGIFRLAPQDYHRFHSPVNAIVGKTKDITGNLYTVNPMAVKENLNVFTRNKRSVLALQTQSEKPILFVAVGAMLVGSIAFTVQEGQKVAKGEELGYFAYGGSTVIVLFPEDLGVTFDEDISNWSKQSFETILEVGQGIATCT